MKKSFGQVRTLWSACMCEIALRKLNHAFNDDAQKAAAWIKAYYTQDESYRK
jgi:Ser/Thr protein kinase RdoA (MazF antagonist)